jgi:hypothetical protein
MSAIDRDDIHININIVGNEKYVVIYNDANRARLAMIRWAINPELSFNWLNYFDASRRVVDESACQGK